MAGVDKMYLKSWYAFDRLVKWSICHCPVLLNYFYDWRMTYMEWDKADQEYVKTTRVINERDLEKIGGKDTTPHKGAKMLIEHYKEVSDYDCPYEQALSEVTSILDIAHKDDFELAEEHSRPVLNTPISIDKKLLWLCPIPEVREYLHDQCGYKRRWEWLYKIFWRGKKEFGPYWWRH